MLSEIKKGHLDEKSEGAEAPTIETVSTKDAL
jgi:hypothetical protein